MSININFEPENYTSLADPIEDMYCTEFGVITRKLSKQTSTKTARTFGLPKFLADALELRPGDPVYFYYVNSRTLVISFKDPELVFATKRKLRWAAGKNKIKQFIVGVPSQMCPKTTPDKDVYIQLINLAGDDPHVWQIKYIAKSNIPPIIAPSGEDEFDI